MIREGIDGFCMALADSVPGVSGGTVAFIMGFYDRFIGSIHDAAFGPSEKRRAAIKYLLKLGIGWLVGMGLASFALSSLFESHIFWISSLFIGFIAGSLPLIVMDEKENLKPNAVNWIFAIFGAALVVGITWLNVHMTGGSMDLSHFQLLNGIKLFFIGMIAICAMFLPGISGSTLLLIFGAYMPVISAIKELLSFHLSYLPSIIFFAAGIIVGALSVVRLIQYGLEHYRSKMLYLILGMMVGSFYAIVMGPTTLSVPQAPLSLESFSWIAAVIGFLLVIGLEGIKRGRVRELA